MEDGLVVRRCQASLCLIFMTLEDEISAMAHSQQADGSVTRFINHHDRHFNAAALIDAAKGYHQHLASGGKMMITLAGAMSTAELGLSLAEMIRQDKVHLISCYLSYYPPSCPLKDHPVVLASSNQHFVIGRS